MENVYKEFLMPIAKGAIQLVPGGSILTGVMEGIIASRERIVLDELTSRVITEEDAADQLFIHNFIIVYDALARTRNQDKLQAFGKILAKSIDDLPFRRSDDPERLVKIILELSENEVAILSRIKYCIEVDWPLYNKRDKRSTTIATVPERYDIFRNLAQWSGLAENELNSVLHRLQAVGCIFLHPDINKSTPQDISLLRMTEKIFQFLRTKDC